MTPVAPASIRACTVAIDDPGPLLDRLADSSDVAWLRRGDGMVGLGVAASASVGSIDEGAAWWEDLARRIEHSTELPGAWGVGPVAFGSFVFDPANTAAASVLVVPRVVIGRRGGRSWLTAIYAGGDPQPAMPAAPEPATGPGRVEIGPGPLGASAWADRVAEAIGLINDDDTELAKVVLARAVAGRAERPIEARWLAPRLADAYPSCWTYHVAGLVGASPELLIRVEGGLATSRVLAGTIRRSSDTHDAELAEALSGSGKDLEEHEFAVASVAEALRPFCSGMNVPDSPSVLQLPNVLHLASDVTGVLNGSVSSLTLAGRLHPSAAVCGTPTPAALAAIAELEGLDRGRYAGPVGWVDSRGDGEWAIALRCGQLGDDPREVTLYAGCGIVGRSVPDAEVAETRAKFAPMLDALDASASFSAAGG